MSESDFIRISEAYRRAERRFAQQVLNVWTRGSTNPDLVSIDFCAADLVPVTVEVLS